LTRSRGKQPLFSPDKKEVLAVNGEIYNHLDIRASFPDYAFQTGSDCEVILALYRQWKEKSQLTSAEALHASIVSMIEKLSGIFAFALYDAEDGSFLIARDPIGVIPLYIGYDKDGKGVCGQ
jgi:asparagine synthase (glutamine-hydrolysing)